MTTSSALSLTSVTHEEATLGNGLRVVAIPRQTLHRTAIGLYVEVGSRHETKAQNGISHFLEHMLYRGTATHKTAHEQNLAFEQLGGTLYAATHADHTYVGLSVPPASLSQVLELLGEVVRAPRFSDLALERRIVREEIMEDVDEDGRQIEPDNVTRAVAFGDHPLGYTITGPASSLERFDEPKLRAHLDKHYVGRNAVLAVAGACDAHEVFALAKKHLGALAAGMRQKPAPFVPTQRGTRRKHVSSPGSQTDLRVSFVTPGEKHPIAPAIELLMRVLDDGMSTRLYHRLCDAGGLVYDTHAEWEAYEECGIVDITGEVQHERLPEVVETIFRTTRELVDEGPTTAELKKARDRHHWGCEASLDGAEDLLGMIGGAVFFDRPRTLVEQASRYDHLTPSDVAAAAREVFRRDRMQFVTVGTLRGKVRERVLALLQKYGRV